MIDIWILMQIVIETGIRNKCLIFLVRLGRRGNLFADLSLVVIEVSRGLGRRLERQDEGSSIDFFKLA